MKYLDEIMERAAAFSATAVLVFSSALVTSIQLVFSEKKKRVKFIEEPKTHLLPEETIEETIEEAIEEAIEDTIEEKGEGSTVADTEVLTEVSLEDKKPMKASTEVPVKSTSIPDFISKSGTLEKQGDILGMMKSRFFKVVKLDAKTAEELNGLSPQYCSGNGEVGALLYWLPSKRGGKYKLAPRGAYDLSDAKVSLDENNVIVIEGAKDAMMTSSQSSRRLSASMGQSTIRLKAPADVDGWMKSISAASRL